MGSMLQCVKLINRGSPGSELNGWGCDERKVEWHTKKLAPVHTGHAACSTSGKAVLLAMLLESETGAH